jgi:hypothetical protein
MSKAERRRADFELQTDKRTGKVRSGAFEATMSNKHMLDIKLRYCRSHPVVFFVHDGDLRSLAW